MEGVVFIVRGNIPFPTCAAAIVLLRVRESISSLIGYYGNCENMKTFVPYWSVSMVLASCGAGKEVDKYRLTAQISKIIKKT